MSWPAPVIAFALALAGATVILVTGQGTRGAALLGFLAAFLLVLGFGPAAMAATSLFVLGSGILTRVGRATKERMRAAEPNRGRRGAANVAAKLGVPAALGLLAAVRPDLRLVLGGGTAAALAGAFADTAATEIGPLLRGGVVRLRGLRPGRAEHGATGGMSLAGLAAGVGAALALALLAEVVGLGTSERAPWLVLGAGVVAMLAESAIAGTDAGRRLGHFGRNAFLSVVAATLGTLLAAAAERGAS